MYIVYSQTNGKVWRRVDSTEYGSDGVLYGLIGNDKVGYHPSCNPAVYELTPEQNEAFDDTKRYGFDAETHELTELPRTLTPIEELSERLDAMEAQVAYTAMMSDTLIEEE